MRKIQSVKNLAPLPLPKIDAARPAGEQIYQLLRSQILEMNLPPASILSETEIGNKIGASRTPVREALQKLRDDGLIKTLPSRGNFVSQLSEARIMEAQFIREGLEVANVRRLAIQGVSAEDHSSITKNLEQQKRAVKGEDHLEFHRLDNEFHMLLARATGFPRAVTVLEREKIQLDRLRALSLRVAGHLQRLLNEHLAIVDAVSQRDTSRAVTQTELHCRSVLDVLQDLQSRHSEFFERPKN